MTLRGWFPLALLLAYGLGFASWALGLSLIGADDHPGQVYRAWHVVRYGMAPWAWDPGWWGGYPELQFYPPALAYAVALLHLATGGAVTIAAGYQSFVWLAYLAPGVTVWLLLRRILGDGWLALPGASVALTLSAGLASGVEGGVHTGMVPARLGWALLPLIPLALAGWTRGTGGCPWATVPLVAGIVLTHPAHMPAAVVVMLVAALVRTNRSRALGQVAIALGLAAGLTAFWTVPLLARLPHTRALAWGSLSAREIFAQPLLVVLIALAALDLISRLRSRDHARPIDTIPCVFAWSMVAVVLIDALVLEPLGIRWLPADRVADSAWLAVVISAGVMVGRVLASRARAPLALAAVALAIALSLPARTLTLWPPLVGWERYAAIEHGLRLPALWSALRAAPPGRVLFVRSGVPLVYGTDWWRPHSHVTALTPLASGREIVNGTFTHPSPIAALVYRGDAGPGAIRELVERGDGIRLFGRSLDELDAPAFNRYTDRLGVSTVVALDEDLPRLRVLRENPEFVGRPPSPPFVIFARRAAVALPREISAHHWRLPPEPTADEWRSARVSYYPLWVASSAGHAAAARRGEMGDLEVRAGAEVELLYGPGVAEIAGLVIAVLSAGALALLWALARPSPTSPSVSNSASASPKARPKFSRASSLLRNAPK